MPRRRVASCLLGVVALCLARAPLVVRSIEAASQPSADLAQDVHALIAGKCLGCHGDKLKLSRLDLRTRESALEGGAKGPALVPGNAEQSRMYRLAAGLDAPAMPMRGGPLTPAEVATMKRWIDAGAAWPAGLGAASASASAGAAAAEIAERPLTDEERGYWAFKSPAQAPLPAVSHTRLTHPIDRFLERTGGARSRRRTARRQGDARPPRVSRSPRAAALPRGSRALRRRRAPNAWERLIDRLLASPHYGER